MHGGGACVADTTVNERAVRILLECILVENNFARCLPSCCNTGIKSSATVPLRFCKVFAPLTVL